MLKIMSLLSILGLFGLQEQLPGIKVLLRQMQ